MDWIYLFIAGLFEIGWPLGLKLSQTSENKILWLAVAYLSMILSGIFLWLAQRSIPMGTAYAIWTGIGASGAFILGVMIFKDAANFIRLASILFIIVGIIGLKLGHN